ncbi:hypothetical protein [Allosphingosinicella indica]|nr:hypothetical protein [Allosphingosinicella indica]
MGAVALAASMARAAHAQDNLTSSAAPAPAPPAIVDANTVPAVPTASDCSQPGSCGAIMLPKDTIVQVAAVNEITSIDMKEGDQHMLQIATDVAQNGKVIIPRGAPVKGKIIWRTGKGIVGKSAKFEIEFEEVTVGGKAYLLKGKHRQEGRGNTAAALLASWVVTGRSAVIPSGAVMNAFTEEDIPST